eukprot:SAG11_NODE_1444_length_4893_cov_7.649979_7_plen_53_part_00
MFDKTVQVGRVPLVVESNENSGGGNTSGGKIHLDDAIFHDCVMWEQRGVRPD